MPNFSRSWILSLTILLIAITDHHHSQAALTNDKSLKIATFLSPLFILGPGSVEDRYYYGVDFPRGHIALKSLNAEVVDEEGNSIPLHETYLHHWIVARYYGLKESEAPVKTIGWENSLPKHLPGRNSGICQNTLGQYFGLGSETRGTNTWVPDPYGIEVGNPEEILYGYEERWMLNVHAIDTRGVEDRLGCTECKCDLYNVTKDAYGRPLRDGYIGGLYCCYDQTHCRLREGFQDVHRKLYLRYTVKWLDWDDSIVPVKIYIMDVTDSDSNAHTKCKVEYQIESCGLKGSTNGDCIDNKRTKLVMPHGGDIIFGVAHQHTGGVGSALYGQDGRVLCTSIPTYGEGKEVGNEAGYIVGMSTCYPKPGSVKIADGEILTLESNYSRSQMHTGVMGLFYILVSDPPQSTIQSTIHEILMVPSTYSWALIAVGIVVVAAAAIAVHHRRRNEREGYQSLVI